MFYEDEKLEQFIKQIVQEQKESEQMETIVLNYFKDKSMSEIIEFTNLEDYKELVKQLKPIRQYTYDFDYHYDIDYFLFKEFSKRAVELQFLDVLPEELIDINFSDIYVLEENNQFYLLVSEMGQGNRIHYFKKIEIKSKEMQITYDFSKELKQLKEKYDKKLKGQFMLELLQALKQHINNDYEKVVKTTESSVYFERTKANDIKEIFLINFVDDNIKYYCVNHQATLDTIKTIEPNDEITFNNTEDIINYLYQ